MRVKITIIGIWCSHSLSPKHTTEEDMACSSKGGRYAN